LFKTAESEDIWTTLRSDVRFAGFLQELENYLEKWGFRCSRELMLTVKNFQEDPRGVLSLLKNYVELDGESPVAALQRQEEERLTETRRVLCCLRKRKFKKYLPWPHEGTVLKLVLRWTQAAISLRERARLKQSLLYSRCRRVMLRLGDKLTLKGLLHRPEDVFFLTHHEVSALISGIDMFPYSVGALIDFRKREHTKLCAMRPPDTFVLKEGTYLPLNTNVKGQEQDGQQGNLERVMAGTGACGGSVTARATVLSDVMESGLLRAGDILVTRQTDPGWAPVFFLVSGLVMERGGMLSHGAIIAREYGIPTVVGVQEATRKIRSGQTLSVDGDTGCVRILD
jgi:phosphohistidine swiveling domain-containing protein